MYNKRKEYEEIIKPLQDAFVSECSLRGIPMFCTVAVENVGTNTKYASDMVSAVTNKVDLSDDKIVKMVQVLNGFDVVESNKPITLEM